MFINAGYGHFVCVQSDMRAIEPIIAHELTHMLVMHLPIPAWLNEGLAVNTERIVSEPGGWGYTPQEMREMHARFWNESTIQEFWSGKSFLRTDDGNLLSYDLARQLVTVLSQDRARFVAFVNAADRQDGGQAAASEHMGAELEMAVTVLLGEGAWRPAPEVWTHDTERGGFAPTSQVAA
jgi:hypothetical protein